MLTLLLLAAAPLLTPAEQSAEKLITAESLKAHVRFLASDALEGRGPGTAGDRLAQLYLATQFEALGLKPLGSDRFFQPVELVGLTGSPDQVTFTSASKSLTLKQHDDVMFVSGRQAPSVSLTKAELVFVGYGITAPEFQWDDFKGLDVTGKVLVVLNNDPEDDPALFAGKTRLYYGRWDYKYEQAQKLGAAGAIIIHTTPSAGYPWSVVQTSWAGAQFELPAAPTGLQVKGWITSGAARSLFALTGVDLDGAVKAAQRRDFKPIPLGVTVTSAWKVELAKTSSANVVAILPGSDPSLKDQAIVITAHHDHLGRKDVVKVGDDGIFNGAVDNASGCAALLTIARAVSSLPTAPKRSIIFAAVAAEEQGLLGSEYFVAHAPIPPAKMAANVNIDGMNIWGRTRDVSVIGLGKSSIDATLIALASGQGRTVHADAMSDRGFFYRSDQFNFAKAGVPAAYYSSGQDFIGRPPGWGREQREKWEATSYHQPSDELHDDWDLRGAIEDFTLAYELVVALGNAPSMPTWTKGDEFEAVRLKALH
jgi:Zn-dependent M28 family amino/carboxypeptidase